MQMTNSRKWEIRAGVALSLALLAAGLGVSHQYFLRSLLLEALEKDNPAQVAVLIQQGAPAQVSSRRGLTPLVAVARWRDRAAGTAVRQVVATGAKVNTPSQGMTALTEAAGRGDLESTRVLLQAGANPNQPGRKGLTPLIFATSVRGRPELLRLLTNFGANVNAPDPNGSTPLMWAIRHGNTGTVKELLELGADVSATNKAGETPLTVAKLRHQRIAKKPRLSRLLAGSERLIEMLESTGRR